MNRSTALPSGVSREEVLAMEYASKEEHILWGGEVYSAVARVGRSFEHNALGAKAILEVVVEER